MLWQDIIISASNILFSYSVIRQALYGLKKKKGFITLQTSLLTAIGLVGISIAMFSLKLYVSEYILAFNASIWLVLFVQRIGYGEA